MTNQPNEERGREHLLWPRKADSPRVAACRHHYRFVVMIQLDKFAPVKVFACHSCGHHRII